MIRAAFVLLGMVSAMPVSAQWAGQGTYIVSGAGYTTPSLYLFPGSGETPTMRQQKLEQSNALREEAAQLQVADGGTLSAEHVTYIRKRVRQILGRSAPLPRTGSLIARK
jgi:hypothetical protein